MQSSETRNKILDVATRQFSRYGFYKTSMDEIAKMSRRAKGSLYYHFASKEELFKEVVASEIENLKSGLKSIVDDTDMPAGEKLKTYLSRRMEILKNAVNYQETLKSDFYEHLDFTDSLRNDLDSWEKYQLKKIILQGIDENFFAYMDEEKINVMLDIFMMVQKGMEIPFLVQGKLEYYMPYFDDMIGILIKGLSK